MPKSLNVSLFFVLAFVCRGAWASELYLGVPRARVQEILELAYNLDEGGRAAMQALEKEYPESPVGLLLQSTFAFWMHEYWGGGNDELAREFLELSKAAEKKVEAYQKIHGSSNDARFARGMIELNVARHYIEQGRWFVGGLKANAGLRQMKRILKDDPDYHDAKMPLGTANCFLAEAPAYMKPLVFVMRFPADRELGMKQFEDVEARGFLAKYEVAYYRIGVQWMIDADHEAAAATADRFLERFPRNAEFQRMRAELDMALGRPQEALARFEALAASAEARRVFSERRRLRIVHRSGQAALRMGAFELARLKGVEVSQEAGAADVWMRAWGYHLQALGLFEQKRFEEAGVYFLKVREEHNSKAYEESQAVLKQMEPREAEHRPAEAEQK